VLTVGAFAHWSTVAYLYVVAGFSSGFGAVDIVAMVFGMCRALFPVLATSVYNAGPVGLGLLSSAMGVGAMVASLTAGWVGRSRAQGRVVVFTVAVWGLAAIGLGLAPSLWVALVALAAGGAADSWSAVARGTVIQTVTPDRLRGRVSAANFMVVVGGPPLKRDALRRGAATDAPCIVPGAATDEVWRGVDVVVCGGAGFTDAGQARGDQAG
jgi:MFS family permease